MGTFPFFLAPSKKKRDAVSVGLFTQYLIELIDLN